MRKFVSNSSGASFALSNGAIALGAGANVTKSYQMMFGSANIAEVVMCGNKNINFNDDGTVTWKHSEDNL